MTQHAFHPPLRISEFESTLMGQALLAGKLVATAVSPQDGKHITMRFNAKAAPTPGTNERWKCSTLAAATTVFADVPGADLSPGQAIGIYSHAKGYFKAKATDQRRVNAARYVLLAAAGRVPGAHVLQQTCCFRCGRELTDPISIRRGMGPHCFGQVTGSQHERRDLDDFVSAGNDLPMVLETGAPVEETVFEPLVDDAPPLDEQFITVHPGTDPRLLGA